MHCVRGRRNEGVHGATSLRQVHYLSPARVLAVRLCSGWQGGSDSRHGWRAPAHARTELAAMDARKARRWVRMLPPRRAGYTSLCAAGWLQPFQQPGVRSGHPSGCSRVVVPSTAWRVHTWARSASDAMAGSDGGVGSSGSAVCSCKMLPRGAKDTRPLAQVLAAHACARAGKADRIRGMAGERQCMHGPS